MEKRNLTGVFFRTQDPVTEKWESRCFEELPEVQRKCIVKMEDDRFSGKLIERLVYTINEIGELTDLIRDE